MDYYMIARDHWFRGFNGLNAAEIKKKKDSCGFKHY